MISAALPSPLPAPSRRAGSGLSRPVTLLGQRTPFPTRLSLGCGAQDRRGWHGGVSGVWGFSLGLLPQGSMGGPAEPGSHAMCVSGRGPPRPPDLSDDAPPPSAGPRSCLPVHPPLGTPRVLHDPVGYPVLLSVPDSQDRVVYFIRSFMTGSAGNGDTGRRLHPEGSAPPRPPQGSDGKLCLVGSGLRRPPMCGPDRGLRCPQEGVCPAGMGVPGRTPQCGGGGPLGVGLFPWEMSLEKEGPNRQGPPPS